MNNMFYSLASTALKLTSSLLLIAIYSRILGFDTFAVFVTAMFSAQMLSILVDAGVNNHFLAKSALLKDESLKFLIHKSVSIRIFFYALISFFLILFFYFKYEGNLYVLIVFIASLLSTIISSLVETASIVMKAKGMFKHDLIINFKIVFFSLLLSLICFYEPYLFILAILLPKFVSFFWYFDFRFVLAYLYKINLNGVVLYYKKLKFYSLDSISTNLNLQLDSILILFILGKDIYAFNQPLNRLYQSSITLAGAISSYAIPKASLATNVASQLKLLCLFFVGSGFLISLAYFSFAKKVVLLTFGDSFNVDIKIVFLYSILLLVRYVAAGFGSCLMLQSMQKIRANINMLLTAMVFLSLFFATSIYLILCVIVTSQILLVVLYSYTLRFKIKKYK